MSSSRDETRKVTPRRQVVSSNKGRMKGKGGPQNQECPYRGVRQRTSGKWVSVIHDSTNNRRPSHWLGTFPTALEAALAYDDASRRLYGPHTALNVPELVAEDDDEEQEGDFDPDELLLFPEEEEEEEDEDEDNDNNDGDGDDDDDDDGGDDKDLNKDMHEHAQETAPVPVPTRTVIKVKVEVEEEEAKSARSDASVNSYAVAAGAGADEFVAADLEDNIKKDSVVGVAKNPKCNESEWTLLK